LCACRDSILFTKQLLKGFLHSDIVGPWYRQM